MLIMSSAFRSTSENFHVISRRTEKKIYDVELEANEESSLIWKFSRALPPLFGYLENDECFKINPSQMSSAKFDKFTRSVPAEKFDDELGAISEKFLLIYESKKFQTNTNLYDKFVLRFLLG